MVIPGGPGSQAFVILLPLVVSQHSNSFTVDADAGPAAFGGPFDALPLDDGG